MAANRKVWCVCVCVCMFTQAVVSLGLSKFK